MKSAVFLFTRRPFWTTSLARDNQMVFQFGSLIVDVIKTHFLNGEWGGKIDAALQSEAPRLVVEFGHLDRSQLSHFVGAMW